MNGEAERSGLGPEGLGPRLRLVQKAEPLVLGIGMLLPCFLAANFVGRFAVDLPYWDEWGLIPLLEGLSHGTLRFHELWAQHNEHRIFFPRLLLLGMARLTGWDTRAENWLEWVLLLTLTVGLSLEHRRTFGRGRLATWLFLPGPWLFFSLRQSQNLLWGFQVSIVLAVAAAALALAALTRSGPGALAWAVAGAGISTFSFAAGLAVWPAGLLVILLGAESRAFRIRRLLAWSVSSLLAVVLFIVGYVRMPGHAGAEFVLKHPVQALGYFSAVVGGPLAGPLEPELASAVGTILLLMMGASAVAVPLGLADREGARLGLAFAAFAVLASALTTLGRTLLDPSGGVGTATSSRYTTMTLLGVYGVYRCALSYRPPMLRAATVGAVLSLVVLGTHLELGSAFKEGVWSRRDRQELRKTLRNYRTATDAELIRLFPSAPVARELAARLEALRLSVFRPSTTPRG